MHPSLRNSLLVCLGLAIAASLSGCGSDRQLREDLAAAREREAAALEQAQSSQDRVAALEQELAAARAEAADRETLAARREAELQANLDRISTQEKERIAERDHLKRQFLEMVLAALAKADFRSAGPWQKPLVAKARNIGRLRTVAGTGLEVEQAGGMLMVRPLGIIGSSTGVTGSVSSAARDRVWIEVRTEAGRTRTWLAMEVPLPPGEEQLVDVWIDRGSGASGSVMVPESLERVRGSDGREHLVLLVLLDSDQLEEVIRLGQVEGAAVRTNVSAWPALGLGPVWAEGARDCFMAALDLRSETL